MANAKTITSPFAIDFRYPLFSKKRNKDSKNLGNIYRASSVLLLAGSNRQANEHIKLAYIIFHLSVFILIFLKIQIKYQKSDTYKEIKSDDLIIFFINYFNILKGSVVNLYLLKTIIGIRCIGI